MKHSIFIDFSGSNILRLLKDLNFWKKKKKNGGRDWTKVKRKFEMKRPDRYSGPPADSTNYRKCIFEFPFTLIDKSTMGFLTGQSWRALNSWYSGGGPEKGFRRYFVDSLRSADVFPVVASLPPTIISWTVNQI